MASRDRATGRVYRDRSLVTTSGQMKEFQVATKVKMVSEMVAGRTRGSTTLKKMKNSEQPSIWAASISTSGTLFIKERIIITPKAPAMGMTRAA